MSETPSNLEVALILRADSVELVRGTRESVKGIDDVKVSADQAAEAANRLATAQTNAGNTARQNLAAIKAEAQATQVLARAREEAARSARLDASLRRDGFDPAKIRAGAAEIVAAKNQARSELGNRASRDAVKDRGAEIVEANALAKANTSVGTSARSAAADVTSLATASGAGAGRLASLRGAAGAAAGEIASAAGVSERAVAALGALGTGAGFALGAVTLLRAGFGGAIVLAQSYSEEVKALEKTIAFAGQTSTITAAQLQSDAARTAASAGQSTDAVIAASQKLILANQNSASEVQLLTQRGAELAQTFGIELGTAVDLVAGQFNALGNGDVAGLNKNFAFLDDGVRRTIAGLAEAGRTADAQALFVKALAEKVDGGPASLSTAFGNAGGAVFDYVSSLLGSFGPIKSAIGFVQELTAELNKATLSLNLANATANQRPVRNAGVVKTDLQNSLGALRSLRGAIRPGEVEGSANRLRFAAGLRRTRALQSEFDAAARLDRDLRDQAFAGIAATRRARTAIALGPAGKRNAQFLDEGRTIVRDAGVKDAREIDRLAGEYADKQIRAAGAIKEQRELQKSQRATNAAANRAEREGEAARRKAAAEAAKANRAAEAAVREIASAYDAVAGKFDPVLAASRQYAEVLKEIALLEKAGVKGGGIDKAQADAFRAAAEQDFNDAKRADLDTLNRQYGLLGDSAAVYAKALREIAGLEGRSVADGGIAKFEGDRLREAAKQRKIADDIGNIIKGRLKDAGEEGAKALRDKGIDAVEAIADVLGKRIANNVNTIRNILRNDRVEGGLDDGFRELLNPLKALFKDLFAKDGDVAKNIGIAIQGAALGKSATSLVGARGSRTGGALGAVAGKATKIPGADVAGSILGSFIGGALKSTKKASASVGFEGGALSVGRVSGNSGSRKSGASSLLSGGIDDLSAIADQLGGILTGQGAGSLGIRKNSFVFDPSGKGRTKGAGVQNFGKDEAAARAAFVLDQLKDGAVSGFSEKVRAAIAGSTSLERGIRDALKVDELEQFIDGVFGPATRAFKEFERQASERVRVARQFGFDLTKVEAANARERKQLLTQTAEETIGDLRALLENFRSGDRATGSLAERRNLLIAQRDQLALEAPTDSDAARRLAAIIAQIDDISLEAFGTAGGQFAADRATNTSIAQRIVDQVNAELSASAARAGGTASATTPENNAIATAQAEANRVLGGINSGVDELADQNAQLIAGQNKMIAALQALVSNSGSRDSAEAARVIGRELLR